ncbi:MAG: membrane protein insertion efficiency factor YidD [Candidatus Omnitrophica bacterium CG23_combo_of_CG06-09_8_20_14_all_40_11]|nr:MAG: membrane protein insertion efficiency factor YidD [Candidatus Omnitrophica bacterium CG23_combo_of_CG06-09_8_20_14_all_40_11]
MLQRVALKLLDIYQSYIRIILPSSCRFVPSCSEYTKQAILRFGFFKGTLKGAKRILRCQPFSQKTGYDPII